MPNWAMEEEENLLHKLFENASEVAAWKKNITITSTADQLEILQRTGQDIYIMLLFGRDAESSVCSDVLTIPPDKQTKYLVGGDYPSVTVVVGKDEQVTRNNAKEGCRFYHVVK